MRPSGRQTNEMRSVSIETGVTMHAEGSCLIKMGNTHVLCTASVDEKVPPFMRNSGLGWVTAEYGMLPRATHTRMRREAKNGQSGRTQEIQRLIGRSLRAGVDRVALGERQIQVDCDVIYPEDSEAGVDGNFIITGDKLIEVQMSAEGSTFSRLQMNGLLDLAEKGVGELRTAQLAAVS